MTPDEQHYLYTQGFEAGAKHSNPSPDTKEFMKETNNKFEEVRETLFEMKELCLTINSKLEAVIIQTTKSNGRVGKLEEWREDARPTLNKLNDVFKENQASKKNLTERIKEYSVIELLKVISFLALAGLVVYFR